MKLFRISSFMMLITATLFLGTGCQAMKDLWPFGGDGDESEQTVDPGDDIGPITTPDTPTDFEPGPVGNRAGEWKRRPELKIPVIYFSYDKFALGAREKTILNQVAAYMKKNPNLGLIIEGHCDERGSEEYNRSLGERRALAVKDYLITQGIPENRIQTQSMGEDRPAVTGIGEAIFAKNRRAELCLANIK
jgi:peptidoglycan-associated lipoprotein